jgi:uncharacterized protein YrzB (UPF0473 family)
LINSDKNTEDYYTITLIDEGGHEHNFEILDVVDNDEGKFYALLPDGQREDLDDDAQDEEFYSYYVFKSIKEDGEEKLVEVFDDNLLDKVGEVFDSRFKKLYDETTEESGFDD